MNSKGKPTFHLIIGPPLSGKTERLMELLEEKHRLDPFSYVFVGPSGFFVREFADKFTRRVGAIIRSNFMSVDEFAVRIYSDMNPHLLHLSREFAIELLSWILDEMKDELEIDENILKSPRFIENTLDLIHDIKEALSENFGEMRLEGLDISEDILKIYEKFEKRLRDLGVYDTFDAYLEINPENLGRCEYGRYLFLDGFYDLSPALRKFLRSVIPTYEEIYMTYTEDERDIFERGATILNLFDELTKDECTGIKEKTQCMGDQRVGFLRGIFGERWMPPPDGFLRIWKFKNHHTEVKNLVRRIKKIIISGECSPGDLAIVTNDFLKYSKLFQREFEEYGVPYRLEGDLKLGESQTVRILTLPFRVVSSGFMVDLLLSMVDFGYVGNVDPKEFETVALDLNLIYGHLRASFEGRKREWIEKVENAIKRETIRLKSLEEVAELPSELNEVREKIDLLRKVRRAIDELFNFLEPIALGGKKDVEFFREKIREWVERLNIAEKLEDAGKLDEIIALKVFMNSIRNLEIFLKKVGKNRLTTSEYNGFLQLITNTNSYKPSPDLDNRVEVLSLEASRFKTKKIKFFVGFVDGVYPRVVRNPLRTMDEREYQKIKENQQKLDLLISLSKTLNKVVLSIPEADINGEPILPSPLLFEMIQDGSIDEVTERIGEMSIEDEPMSMLEFKTRYMLGNYPDERIPLVEKSLNLDGVIGTVERLKIKERFRVKNVEFLLRKVGNEYSFAKLNTFEECPFRFFLRYFMGIPEIRRSRFEFTPLEKGIIYHRVLKDVFSMEDTFSFSGDRKKILEESIRKNMKPYLYHDDELVEEKELAYFLYNIEKFLNRFFEMSNNLNIKNIETYPVELEMNVDHEEDGIEILNEPLKLIGRIDRVDKLKDDEKYFIIDYKMKNGDYRNRRKQLMLYTYVYNKIKGGNVVFGGCNLLIEEVKYSNLFTIEYEGDDWIADFYKSKKIRLSEVLESLRTTVESIKSGIFEPGRIKCRGCSFSNVCGSLIFDFHA